MPSLGRVLPFRGRSVADPFSQEEVATVVDEFFATEGVESLSRQLSNPDVFFSVVSRLWATINSAPARVREKAASLHHWLTGSAPTFGVFDERDFGLGEAALLAGTACRVTGQFETAETWLDFAENSY